MNTQPRILVVDDDAGGRRLTRATLTKVGFSVREAGDGQAALEAIQAEMPDLVLLDVSMPVMDGFTACAQLRQMPGGDRVPVVMMTGLDDTQSIDRAFEAGATDFITKPINWAVLPHRVRYMLRASAAINDLQQNQRRLSNAQRIGEMGDWEWDLRADRIAPSEQAWRIFGHERDTRAVPAEGFFTTVHPDDSERLHQACDRAVTNGEGFAIDHRIVMPDGAVRHVHQQVEVIERQPEGPALRLAGAVHDISRRKDAEEQIRRLAYFDPLTGLPNRLLFSEQLGKAIAQAGRYQRRLAIMFVDLDNFKRVNDTLGHNAGDELLRNASGRLAGVLRSHDSLSRCNGDDLPHSIARLGGDEFIVLLTDVPNPDDAAAVAQRLVDTLNEPVTIQGTEIFVGGSVGVAMFPEDGADIDTLLMNADTAMYRAKAAGRGGFQLYDRSMNARALDRLRMETRLRRALERQEFVLHYQPRVDVVSGRIVGAEALIRWQHPERGLLPPAEFIPLVEDAGLVIPIGEWVIETVCAQSAAWHAAGLDTVPVAVNLASTHLRERGLPGLVAKALRTHGVPARCLEIEVTESILLADPELSVAIAQELATMGVQLSIDDFGTGYSSLGYLKKLPIASLKIDRSFVRDLVTDPDDEAIVSAIIALAHSLKLRVVAEGVETEAQLAYLQAMRCDEYQGFLTSRAIEPVEFGRMLERRAAIESAFTPLSRPAELVFSPAG
ncbi:bifunctional diguanylate cyclase/phosphodiesterase [Ideonella sp. A 288]|uniref:putative bifunctional diguanylate cyclase/phosphodiesterase n=1 Tax=Ideonella sp. A 288 TaxID=1962181 RepID=UPI000B4A7EBF|nr:EAL domain-containing protein [Ideonella sp. A 288]